MSRERAVVDVIVPTRNRLDLTRQAIASVEAQTMPSWRLLVVDDASDDGSVEGLRANTARDPRIEIIERGQRGGQQVARQTGLDASTAPFVAILDSDDLWLPTKLEKQVARFRAAASRLPRLGAVLCWHDWVDMQGRSQGKAGRPRVEGPADPLISNNMSALLVRREALDRAGGFVPPGYRRLRRATNIDLYVRLTQECDFVSVEEPLVRCRVHEGDRASDEDETLAAAEDLEYVVEAQGDWLARNPQARARLRASVGARYLAVGHRRRGLSYLALSLVGGGPGTAFHIMGRYGPFALKSLVAGGNGSEPDPIATSRTPDHSARPAGSDG
jgi:glycosyltransferase involved in cell wall biosynthesis